MPRPQMAHGRWTAWAIGASVVVSLVALAWPTWLEPLIGEGGDGGDGSIEHWLAIALAVLALSLARWRYASHHRSVRRARGEVRHGG